MKHLPTILFVFLALNMSAQHENQLLKNFNYRTKGYLGIQLQGDSKTQNYSTIFTSTKLNGNEYNFNFNPQLFGFYASDNQQVSYNVGLAGSMIRSKVNNEIFPRKNSNIDMRLPLNFDYKRFYSNEKFIGISLNENAIFQNQVSLIDTIFDSHQSNYLNFVNPALKVGKGRINNIQPMEKALWILRDLKNENLLSTNLDESETIELANALLQIDNTRMFDYRRKNKFALNLILEKLKSHVNPEDQTKALNVIQDNYYFALNTGRYRGQEIYLELSQQYNVTQFNGKSNNESKHGNSHQSTPSISLNFNNYKPLSLTRQLEYGANVQTGITFNKSTFTNEINDTINSTQSVNEKTNFVSGQAYLQYAYYPSTRSNIATGVLVQLYKYFESRQAMFLSPYVNFNYMINYRLRFQGKVGANYFGVNNLTQNHTDQVNLSSSLNLVYFLR